VGAAARRPTSWSTSRNLPSCSTRPDGTAFADLDINGHRETWPIRRKGIPQLACPPLL